MQQQQLSRRRHHHRQQLTLAAAAAEDAELALVEGEAAKPAYSRPGYRSFVLVSHKHPAASAAVTEDWWHSGPLRTGSTVHHGTTMPCLLWVLLSVTTPRHPRCTVRVRNPFPTPYTLSSSEIGASWNPRLDCDIYRLHLSTHSSLLPPCIPQLLDYCIRVISSALSLLPSPQDTCEFLVAESPDGALDLSDVYWVPLGGDEGEPKAERPECVGDIPAGPRHYQSVEVGPEFLGNVLDDKPGKRWVSTVCVCV